MSLQFLRRTRHLGMSDEARAARMTSLGGSDARIIMSGDQHAIERLWREKRGEQDQEDMSEILLVQMGNTTEQLNADWFEFQMNLAVTNEQDKVFYKDWDKAHATLDGLVRKAIDAPVIAMVEFKFMMPFGFDKQKAFDKYYAQCQHNMMVMDLPLSYLSIITGAAQHVVMEVEADIFYQAKMLQAEQDFWDCVQTGRTPGVPVIEVPLLEKVRVADMSTDNEWCDLAQKMVETKSAVDEHEKAKKAIKKKMPQDAKIASGKGVTISYSSDGKMLVKVDKEAVKQADKDSGRPLPEAKPKRSRKAANNNDKPATAAEAA
ncbi:YqaJ viral recombinase family protein [Bradyrhizobium pachyrhizi]|uniref:YqaJ viral recombinase family protein n=1 Tax=Bradyrhizobium pachyrhizi TaxID=280333 RepID=UPI0024B0B3B9|nr:YqaJ viral recombinase family protein [Bradyrhizobium pachyrhizi]WFU52199.1 YqaJ viral recombinase family protein [Bradyrhizobium pachyrhizi]